MDYLKYCKRFFSSSDLPTIYEAYIRLKIDYISEARKTALSVLDWIKKKALTPIGNEKITQSLHSVARDYRAHRIAIEPGWSLFPLKVFIHLYE